MGRILPKVTLSSFIVLFQDIVLLCLGFRLLVSWMFLYVSSFIPYLQYVYLLLDIMFSHTLLNSCISAFLPVYSCVFKWLLWDIFPHVLTSATKRSQRSPFHFHV